ncbi:MAG TPA: 6-phosphogluconolactonase [Acidobacteriaceae bacterium]|nr:6-phosphogluconolactonase [Acidobacteriaceae bacterium]
MATTTALQRLKADSLNIEIYADLKSASDAAAREAAQALVNLDKACSAFGVIFATGSSQIETLEALTAIPGLPWNKVIGFHLDEYIGMPADHPASFRGYLQRHLLRKVTLKEFNEIDGTAPNIDEICRQYALNLQKTAPQLCLLGVGENGHLAFNDPDEANFNDPQDVRIVRLDPVCRQQQASEGWFDSLEEVPEVAVTVTIPALFRVPKLVLTVVGSRKATAVERLIEGPISTNCPATILRRHSDATLYLDQDAAANL